MTTIDTIITVVTFFILSVHRSAGQQGHFSADSQSMEARRDTVSMEVTRNSQSMEAARNSQSMKVTKRETGSQSSKYEGAFLGKLNTYAHQVTGDVFVIDEYTFLIKGFTYDGLGQDAFFWAGATVRPSNIGFIVPDQRGRTNKLNRYNNQDITIRIPDGDKKIQSLKWLSIWDIRDNRNFADIYIPDGFSPPSPQKISEFSQESHGVKSGPLLVLDSKRIQIENFFYDGSANSAYFWVGTGPVPSSTGKKIPDDLGYLEPLGRYEGETLILSLPGEMTVFEIDWIAIWDEENQQHFGSVSFPDRLNIPPSLTLVQKRDSRLPNCQQLHRHLQLSWEIFGPQITFEISAQIRHDDFVAFGLSGSNSSTQMIASDVALSYIDRHIGFTTDYNITDKFPCTSVNGYYRGVCPDTKVGGVENYQIFTFFREDGITRLTFRRNLVSGDEGDLNYLKEDPSYIVWSVGRLNKLKEPRFHYLYPKKDVKITFGRKPEKNCFPFTEDPENDHLIHSSAGSSVSGAKSGVRPWGPLRIANQTMTTFYARIGVSGGDGKGYAASTDGQGSPGLVWYINGLMAPVLVLKRGRSYTFRVEGGNNPNDPMYYHPFYITDDPNGGYSKMKDEERKSVRIFAGIEFDRKGRPNPTSAGRLCLWSYFSGQDPRRSDLFPTFTQFRSALNYSCEKKGSPALLTWTPNQSTPDVVYYQSWTQRNMGWKILILDDYNHLSVGTATGGGQPSASSSVSSSSTNVKAFLHTHFTLSLFSITVHYTLFSIFHRLVHFSD